MVSADFLFVSLVNELVENAIMVVFDKEPAFAGAYNDDEYDFLMSWDE